MKKAKEYAADILKSYESEGKEAAIEKAAYVIKDLLKEYIEIKEQRNYKTIGAAFGLIRELHFKWESIVKQFNEKIPAIYLNRKAFLNCIEDCTSAYPDLIGQYPELEK